MPSIATAARARRTHHALRVLSCGFLAASPMLAEPPSRSGVYPSLAFFNDEGECGTGAVVPWADRLWVVTYAPHAPEGSTDKLYEITPDLRQIVRPESIGGTPANRMIHAESRQLFLGPHVISHTGEVRTIPYSRMFGRPTGNARSLSDPAGKLLCATMEEGIYEIDVKDLAVTEQWGDEQKKGSPRKAKLPGYHGKGFYSGQGVYVYANNGDHAPAAREDPTVPSGVLAEWDGKSDAWTVVRRNQFTEVTGPGGIHGNPHPATDPIWTIGWDAKSLLLGVRMPQVGWTFYRLPKGSHSYDGAHGWNTEWPRIRDIGERDLLMTMHGTFWSFPRDFTPTTARGIRPRSNYLKVIGDFCRWNERLVFGCDDTARNEFLNRRKAKGSIAAPQSQSNLWFLEPAQLDHLGPAIGRGALWLREEVKAGVVSDPLLVAGYRKKGLHLARDGAHAAVITLEVDARGDGSWSTLRRVTLEGPSQWVDLSDVEGTWIRLSSSVDLKHATAAFLFSEDDARGASPDPSFAGLATFADRTAIGGVIRARAGNTRTLALAAIGADGKPLGGYELGADLVLRPAEAGILEHTLEHARIPVGVVTADAASVLFTDDLGRRWRLPKGDAASGRPHPFGGSRAAREVATERDLFHAGGSFYELPAENAGGFAKIRPVCTHGLAIHDYGSFRGLFVMTGLAADAPASNPHVIRSADGKAALWVGAVDDLWKMGKPRGTGGPWRDSAVKAGVASDPYLMTGYDAKSLVLESDAGATVTAEIDPTGDGNWVVWREFPLEPGKPLNHAFPAAFSAYWIRFRCDRDATVSAQLDYR